MERKITMKTPYREGVGFAVKGKYSLVKERQIDFQFLTVASKKLENACEYSNGFKGDFSLNKTCQKALKRGFLKASASTYTFSYNPSFAIQSNLLISW
jgi:hypothetical protein